MNEENPFLSVNKYVEELLKDRHPYCEKCLVGRMYDRSDGEQMLYECDKCGNQIIFN